MENRKARARSKMLKKKTPRIELLSLETITFDLNSFVPGCYYISPARYQKAPSLKTA